MNIHLEEKDLIYAIRLNKILLDEEKTSDESKLNKNELGVQKHSNSNHLLEHLKHFTGVVLSYLRMKTTAADDQNNNFLSESKIYDNIKDNINVKTAALFYQLSTTFNLIQFVKKAAFSLIARCFTMVAETDNYLKLDHAHVSKILASCGLRISTELEVFNAANAWLQHDAGERRKFANDLLFKVRLNLLPEYTLNCLLDESSIFSENCQCKLVLYYSHVKSMFPNLFKQINSSFSHTNRYCNEEKFDILFCGGRDIHRRVFRSRFRTSIGITNRTVNQIDGNDFKSVKGLSPMVQEERRNPKAVCLKGEVYVFGGRDGGFASFVEKYSPSAKTWKKVADMHDDRVDFCACAFMDKIVLFGGRHEWNSTNTFLQFDTKDCKWKEGATRMKFLRTSAACAVFEERIVVSGGYSLRFGHLYDLDTVEQYDVIADKWYSMPNMVFGKSRHSLVAVRNKLFVIAANRGNGLNPGNGQNWPCEVFDSNTCKKFVAIKSPAGRINGFCMGKVISIGSRIFVFEDNNSQVHCYDVDKEVWSCQSCEVTRYMCDYSCAKIPWY